MGCGMDGQTDRRTDGVKPIYHPTTLLGGIIILKISDAICYQ